MDILLSGTVIYHSLRHKHGMGKEAPTGSEKRLFWRQFAILQPFLKLLFVWLSFFLEINTK